MDILSKAATIRLCARESLGDTPFTKVNRNVLVRELTSPKSSVLVLYSPVLMIGKVIRELSSLNSMVIMPLPPNIPVREVKWWRLTIRSHEAVMTSKVGGAAK